jgi:hypothetical protein
VKEMNFTNEKFPLVFAGGNLTHENSLLAAKLTEKIHLQIPQASISFPSVDAAEAMALLVNNSL